MDGTVFVSMHNKQDFDCASLGIPWSCAAWPATAGSTLSYVDADNIGGAQKAVSHLLAAGRRHIATIAGPPDMSPGVDRLLGYRKAMTAADLTDPGMIAYGDFSRPAGEHALTRLLDHRPALDAVFVASDLMAVGALRALRRLGRRVPDDVAVIGFDDSALAQLTEPRLSTVRQPVDAMAEHIIQGTPSPDHRPHPQTRPLHPGNPAHPARLHLVSLQRLVGIRVCQVNGSVALSVVTLRRLTREGSGDEGVRSRRGRTSVV